MSRSRAIAAECQSFLKLRLQQDVVISAIKILPRQKCLGSGSKYQCAMLQFDRFSLTILTYKKDRSEIPNKSVYALYLSIRKNLYTFMPVNTFYNMFQVCLRIFSMEGIVNVSKITSEFSLFLDQAAFKSLVSKGQGCSHSCKPSTNNQSSGNNVNDRLIEWLNQPCLGYCHADQIFRLFCCLLFFLRMHPGTLIPDIY